MSDTAEVDRSVTEQNVKDACQFLYELSALGSVLSRMDENFEDLETHRCRDLGQLVCRLTEYPLDVLSELRHEIRAQS